MTRNTPPPQPTALTEALAARYGAGLVPNPPDDLPAAAAQVLHQILSHRTWGAFRPDPLPAGAVELAIAAAQSAATSSNLQSWSVIAVRDAALKARLNAIAGDQPHVAQAPVLLVFLADLNRPRRVTEDLHSLERRSAQSALPRGGAETPEKPAAFASGFGAGASL